MTGVLRSVPFIIVIISSFAVTIAAQNEPVVLPKVPMAPNCGNSFPGTQKWNSCWEKFREDMANFQQRMQAYGKKVSEQMADKNFVGNGAISSSGTSSVMTNGYTIRSNGIPISTNLKNSIIQIQLMVGIHDSFESKTEGNEIEMKIRKGESTKWVKIKVPSDVKISDLKLERSSDTIMITGPAKSGFGEFSGTSSIINLNSGNQGQSSASSFQQNTMQSGAGIPIIQNTFPLFERMQFPQTIPQMWLF